MKYLDPHRIAAVLLLLFCAGHTIGGMLGNGSLGPGDAVFAQMKSVHFTFNGSDSTFYGFWFGLGLITSVFLLFSALVSWRLASVAAGDWHVVTPIAWALFASHVANAVLTLRYFFAGAGFLASLIALLLGVGALRKSRRTT